MGKTLVIFRVKCDDMDQLDQTVAAIGQIKSGEVKDTKRFPIGFGIEEIKVAVLIPEKQDKCLDDLQAEMRKIPNVTEIEIETMTLL